MRVGAVAVAVAAVVVAGACRAGDGGGEVTPPTTAASVVVPTTPAPATSTTAAPAGTVTLRASGISLAGAGAGGTGLRLLVRAASPRLTVGRRGGEGAVSACPIAGATPSPSDGPCVDLAAGAVVELPFAGGVEVRATGPAATLDAVTVTYVAATRQTTVVTPARPAGACAAARCESAFTLTPAGAGAFVLDGRAGGGRPRLVLTAMAAGGSVSNSPLATVEGGGSLSIRATLEAGSEARLLHQEEGPHAVAPVTAEILWP